MSQESEKNRQQPKQQPGQQDPTGSVNTTPNTNTNPPHGNQSQVNRPQEVSKKNPSQDSDSQHKGQQKPEDEKRRAS
jgi:hypothetical protein